jgi:site-specific DNA-methyltransferase (adenine-specific)
MADGSVWPRQSPKMGDYEVIDGDCLQVMASPQLPPGSVDVVVTSPPYNLNLSYNLYDDAKTEDDYIAWLVKVVGKIKAVLKPHGSFFLNLRVRTSRSFFGTP